MGKKILVFSISFLLAVNACATVPRTSLSADRLSVLQGRWEGKRDITQAGYRSSDYAVLDIYNDTVPLRGQISIAFMEGTDTRVYPFENGGIDPQGNFSAELQPGIRFLVSLYEGKEIKLDGSYFLRGNEGRLTLFKK